MNKLSSLLKKYRRTVILLLLTGFFAMAKYVLFEVNYDRFYEAVAISTYLMYLSGLWVFGSYFIRKKLLVPGNIVILLMLIVITEMVFYALSGMPKKQWVDYTIYETRKDQIGYHLGDIPNADTVTHDFREKDGNVIVDADYTIDSLVRRVTPGHDSSKHKYALFFGCSVCFGFGLEDNQTLPYYFQENTTSYNSYNYAYLGWGMHHMLARLEYKDLSEEIPEKDGVAIYVFLWSHIRRAIGDMRVYTTWGHTMPYYTRENGKVVHKGNFTTGRPYVSRIYALLSRTYTFKYLKLNLPFSTDMGDYELAADIILKAKEEYTKQFGNDDFYVLIHPLNWNEFTPERKEMFIELLKERKIDYLDYSGRFALGLEELIPGDPHPNEKVYQKIGKMIVEDVMPNEAVK